MYAFVAELGYCIYVNQKHPIERRRATLAHEYGHFLCDRHTPGIDYLERSGRKPANERFAEAFGLSFLMPAAGIRRQFHEITASTGNFRVSDLCRLSNFYFVSVQALTLRLENLGLIDRGTWDMLVEKGFKPRLTAQDLGLRAPGTEFDERYPERYRFLAVRAYEAARISEGQLCKFLRCDPVSARGIVAECSSRSYVDESGETRFGRMPFELSLLEPRR
jgi:Zn-dependent peptidase ImmA (M78 family)